MLMSIDMLAYTKPEGEQLFTLMLPAPDEILKKALAYEKAYSFVYGHRIFLNLQEIQEALQKTTE